MFADRITAFMFNHIILIFMIALFELFMSLEIFYSLDYNMPLTHRPLKVYDVILFIVAPVRLVIFIVYLILPYIWAVLKRIFEKIWKVLDKDLI